MSVSIKILNKEDEFIEISSVDKEGEVEVTLESQTQSVSIFLPVKFFQFLVDHIQKRVLRKEVKKDHFVTIKRDQHEPPTIENDST